MGASTARSTPGWSGGSRSRCCTRRGATPRVGRIALREARAAAAIAHPNATAVYDVDEIEGTSFIVMEFVAGTSLRAIIAGPPVPLATRLRWLIDVAAALAAAHRMGSSTATSSPRT